MSAIFLSSGIETGNGTKSVCGTKLASRQQRNVMKTHLPVRIVGIIALIILDLMLLVMVWLQTLKQLMAALPHLHFVLNNTHTYTHKHKFMPTLRHKYNKRAGYAQSEWLALHMANSALLLSYTQYKTKVHKITTKKVRKVGVFITSTYTDSGGKKCKIH